MAAKLAARKTTGVIVAKNFNAIIGKRNTIAGLCGHGGEAGIADTSEMIYEWCKCLDDFGTESKITHETCKRLINDNPHMSEALTVKFATVWRIRRKLNHIYKQRNGS